jgi:hypothetical protein
VGLTLEQQEGWKIVVRLKIEVAIRRGEAVFGLGIIGCCCAGLYGMDGL